MKPLTNNERQAKFRASEKLRNEINAEMANDLARICFCLVRPKAESVTIQIPEWQGDHAKFRREVVKAIEEACKALEKPQPKPPAKKKAPRRRIGAGA